MVDHIAPMGKFIVAGREVHKVRLRVGINWIDLDVTRCEVDKAGMLVVNIPPEPAMRIAKELNTLARACRHGGQFIT
jgi:hypothetical protein